MKRVPLAATVCVDESACAPSPLVASVICFLRINVECYSGTCL